MIDLLFAANGQTYESLQPHVLMLTVEGVNPHARHLRVAQDQKTNYRDKDQIDRKALSQILEQLKKDG